MTLEKVILIAWLATITKSRRATGAQRVRFCQASSVLDQDPELPGLLQDPLTVNVKLTLKRFGAWLTPRSRTISNQRNYHFFNIIEEGIVNSLLVPCSKIALSKNHMGLWTSLPGIFAETININWAKVADQHCFFCAPELH